MGPKIWAWLKAAMVDAPRGVIRCELAVDSHLQRLGAESAHLLN